MSGNTGRTFGSVISLLLAIGPSRSLLQCDLQQLEPVALASHVGDVEDPSGIPHRLGMLFVNKNGFASQQCRNEATDRRYNAIVARELQLNLSLDPFVCESDRLAAQ
jgi:hypothetical protein